MAKYSVIELTVKKGALKDIDSLSNDKKKALKSKNAIYIYRGTSSGKVYIEQTIHFMDRHKQHFDGSEEKFNTADFDKVIVIFSVYFNRSALDDVESQLITYFKADCSKGSGAVSFDNDVINRTGGNSVNEYAERENVASDVILPIWEKVLYPKGWVRTETLDEVRTSVLVKYSPIKQLTSEQGNLIEEIVGNSDKNYVINGDVGTGKTVLLTNLVARILKERPEARVGVVVQPNWEKTGAEIFRVYGMNRSSLSVATSTKMIEGYDGELIYDVIVVDEAHKLSRKYSKQHPSFGRVYKTERFEKCESHLEILQKIGGQIILMYDVLQAIRPAHIQRDQFRRLTEDYEKRFLKTQFRIQAPKGKNYTSDDYVNGIKYLLYKDTNLLDSSLTNYNPNFNRDVFRDRSEDAYFGYVTDQPLHKLFEWIENDRNLNPEHINRVLGGLVEPWKQSDGKNPNKMHWEEGEDCRRRWNSRQENWINSSDLDAEDQIGSVFAVQGIDLNRVGVLIGADLEVVDGTRLEANHHKFHNTNGMFTAEEMKDENIKSEFTLFVKNIYYVLLTRGIDGVRIGFWHNDPFIEYMEKTLEINN